ncbi:MAG: VOC family protein [Methylocella sp.]
MRSKRSITTGTSSPQAGDPAAQQCGWLKDRYGLSWQVVPTALLEMIADPDRVKSQKATAAMLQMKKLDIAALQRAFDS